MNTREIATEYRLSYWTNVISERKESGLNVIAYCKTIGIHPNTYFYWQKRVREAVCTEILQLPMNQPNSIKKPIPAGWAVCEPAKPEEQNKTIYIEIGKSRVTITDKIDRELLTEVCRVLTEIC